MVKTKAIRRKQLLANSTGWDGSAIEGPPKKRFIKNSTQRPLKDDEEETDYDRVTGKECDDDHDEGEEEKHEDDQTEKKGGYDEKENAFIIPSPCNAGFQ